MDTKCSCQHCDGHIAFDTNQLNPSQDVSVPCPHCGAKTTIFAPEQRTQPPSRQDSEVQGSMGYFELADWWLNSLTKTERTRIILLNDPRRSKTLTEGTISCDSAALTLAGRMPMGFAYHSSGLGFQLGINCVDYLLKIVRFHLNPEKAGYGNTVMVGTKDFGLRAKIIQKIIEELDKPETEVVDKHIAYSFLAMIFYSERKIDGLGIQRAIWACLKQIEISPEIKSLMRTPTRLTEDDLRRLSQKAAKSGQSLWKYCLDQNIYITNSIVRDTDIPHYDEGYRFLAEIFKNEKQYDRLVALCEKAIELGWEGMFWKQTLTKNRVYLGDESPASEWLPALPELKWDETLLNIPPTIPAPEIKPISDVPEYDLRFVNGVLQPLTPEQNAFYLKLVDSIKNKTYLPVGDQDQYLNLYIREKYKTFDRENLERLYDELLILAVPYSKVGNGVTWNINWKPTQWSYDCLLALEYFDKYFEVTKPSDIFSACPRLADIRCNVRYFLGLPASGLDLLAIYSCRKNRTTKYTKQNPVEYERILESIFAEEQNKNGSWLERILATSDRVDYGQRLFGSLHFARSSKIPHFSFDQNSKQIVNQLCDAFREAENRLRDLLGEKRVGEKWDEETKLLHTVKKMFPDLQIIHHGQPDWLGRMHLDVWIPELKIAIEYHGQQHFEEMKHFGGAESLKETKRRDALKRSACKREGVQLFEITSIEDAQVVIKEIRKAASLKNPQISGDLFDFEC